MEAETLFRRMHIATRIVLWEKYRILRFFVFPEIIDMKWSAYMEDPNPPPSAVTSYNEIKAMLKHESKLCAKLVKEANNNFSKPHNKKSNKKGD